MRFAEPDSGFERFVIHTRYLRFVARRIHLQYTSKVDQDTRVKLRFGTSDRWAAEEMFDTRPYERYFSPEAGQVVVDAGANIGCFTLRSARLVGPSGSVVAFEPSATSFSILMKNLRLNGLRNTLAMNFGLGEKEDISKYWVYDSSLLNSTAPEVRKDAKLVGVESVQLRVLDDVLDEQRIKSLDYLKLDTEGAELAILRGAKKSLSRFHPRIAGEAHPGWSYSGATILEYLKTFGYKGLVGPSPSKDAEFFYAWPAVDDSIQVDRVKVFP